MKISVVINTYNRCNSLKNTLTSLRHQTYSNFEVIIVNGPSTDDTENLLRSFQGNIKHLNCLERNLSISRNIGINASSGDIVAFIDDDAIASPTWLEDLVQGYNSENIGGVGGTVYDNTGLSIQAKYIACYRSSAKAKFDIIPPFNKYNTPRADPFLTFMGTNCSFRRSVLVKVGGFDEEYDYFLDETDLCMRIIDAGFILNPVDKAIVHHKFLASHIRNHKHIILNPYSIIKNIAYFTVKNYLESNKNNLEINIPKEAAQHIKEFNCIARKTLYRFKMTLRQYFYFIKCSSKGEQDGIKRALENRKTRNIIPCNKSAFLQFSFTKPKTKPMTLCFASEEYPPKNYGGIGRFSHDLASGFAKFGHNVHVITKSYTQDSFIDYQEGVWVHYINAIPKEPYNIGNNFYDNKILFWSSVWYEVLRIHKENPISLLTGPLWSGDTLIAACENKFPVVLSFMTTHHTMSKINKSFAPPDILKILLSIEKGLLNIHDYGHAISNAIKNDIAANYTLPPYTFVLPLCVEDNINKVQRSRRTNNNTIRILTVGRIEPRKGTDILLSAAKEILKTYSNVEFYFIGREVNLPNYHVKDNLNSDYLSSKIKFLGEISEADLLQNYIDCDIFCLPSRYESFGLVLLEAMVMGKPCIASDSGGMQEILIHNQTGFIFKNENTSELINYLTRLIDDHELRDKMGKNSRKRYETSFSPEVIITSLEKQYLDIIKNYNSSNNNIKDQSNNKLQNFLINYLNIPSDKAQKVASLMANPELEIFTPDVIKINGLRKTLRKYFFIVARPIFLALRRNLLLLLNKIR